MDKTQIKSDIKPFSLDDQAVTLKILIIEDNPGDIIIIRELLRNSGLRFNLTSAHTLGKAQEFLKDNKFDVILLDLGLPDSMGLETLKEFLFFEIQTPVVVMTGLDDEETSLEALREGAQDYLVKSRIDSDNILRSIKYSIERKKLENLQKRNSHQLSVLSETTASLYDGDEIPPIFSLICRSIKELVGKPVTLSIEVDGTQQFRITNYEQLKPYAEKIFSLSNLDFENEVFKVAEQKKELVCLFMDGRLHLLQDGIYEIMCERVSRVKCNEFERITGIRFTYVIGFARFKNYYGGIIIYTESLIAEDDMRIIENLCSQASLGIYRRMIKKNLIKSENKYQKLAEELDEKVKERTRSLEIANKKLNKELKERKIVEEALRKSEVQLKELNATKDKFFNIVAHDLKNPFTSLLGATELLSQNIQNMDNEKIRKLAQILNESSKSGYAILLNLLDWSRSQTGLIKINPQNLNLTKLLDDNITDMRLNSLDKQISLIAEISDDINIVADKNMLNTILRNLLSNAVKFTPRGGNIIIRAEVRNNEAVVSVKDNGIGISEENIDKIFRIDSKYTRPGTEKEVGTGLGLKLSKEFIEKLGGKIRVNSSENKGSEFVFSIPLPPHQNP